MRRFIGIIIALLCTLATARAQGTPQPTFSNVVYKVVDGISLGLDIWLPPTGTGPFPVVLYVHGGAYLYLDRTADQADQYSLSTLGFAVVSIDYRQSFQATWPAPLHDAKSAVRWIRDNAQTYGFDAARIGAFGFSTGGQLVAMLGMATGDALLDGPEAATTTTSAAIDCWTAFGGPFDFIDWQNYLSLAVPWVTAELGGSTDPNAYISQGTGPLPPLALALTADPVNYATSDDPPCYLGHGEADPIVGAPQSHDLFLALKNVNVPVELRIVPGLGHGPNTEELARRSAWLERHLMPSAVPFPATLELPDPLLMETNVGITVHGTPGAIVYLYFAARPDYLPLGQYGNLLIPFDDCLPVGSDILNANGRFDLYTYFPLVPSLMWQTLYVQGFAQSGVFGPFTLTDVVGVHVEF